MTEQIKVLVALEKGVDAASIQDSLPLYAGIELIAIVEGLDEAWSALQESRVDLLLVACAGYSERVIALIGAAAEHDSTRPVVLAAHSSPNGFVRRAFEAGADDFLVLPEKPDHVLFTMEKAVARKRGAAAAAVGADSPLICVLGPKGGTGKTLTSCNLAVALAKQEKKVALVDLDLQFGDVGLSLGVRPELTIADLARSGGAMDAEKLEAYLATHDSGLRLLLAPLRPDQASVLTPQFLRELYPTLRAEFDYVVVDTAPGFSPEVIASIDSSTHVCMVGTLDSLSLKNTKLGLETLELMGYSPDHIAFVLNRADSRVGISRDDVRTIVGRAPDVLVPSDRQIAVSVNEGRPVVSSERSEAAKAFERLARLYMTATDRSVEDGAGDRAGLRRLLARTA